MIFFVLILGLGLRLISLNQSFWIDEATSALTTKMSLFDFFSKFLPGDFHPPLYYLALRAWAILFGTSEIALRSLSVLFGILAIYFVYRIGKELINREVGIIASLFLATSGLHIYYSQEARMYSMSTFLVTAAIFSFVKILKRESGVGNWILFSILLGLIGLTDYLPLLILPVFWLAGIFMKKSFKWFTKLLMSHIILGFFALLWVPTFIKQLNSGINVTNTSPSWVAVLGKLSFKDILLISVKFMIGRVSFDNKYIYGVFVLMVFLLFGFLIFKTIKYFKQTKLIWLWLTVPLGLALIISLKFPVLNYFRFLFVLPAFYLLLAFGVQNLKGKTQKIILIIVIAINLITSFMYLTNIKFQREDWKAAVPFIESMQVKNSRIIFSANSQMEAFRYYDSNANLYGPEGIKKGLSEIWLVRYAQAISDPTDSTRAKIEALGYKKMNEYDFNGVATWKYVMNLR